MYDRTTPDSLCHIVADGGIDALEEFRRTGHWDSPQARTHTAAAADPQISG
jgi:hypothetical protein